MFAPDVQGPMSTRTLGIINFERPQLIMMGGVPLYLSGFNVDEGQIKAGLENSQRVVKIVPNVILEHHILRDEDWRDKTKTLFDTAQEAGCKILTAAEFLGEENTFLEARRKMLFVDDPPSKEFEKWMQEGTEMQKHLKPRT
jgi:hypothetical protein